MIWLWGICAALGAVAGALAVRLIWMHRDVNEICEALQNLLQADSNALLTTASGDRAVRRLAARLNGQLRKLRSARNRLESGQMELQQAVTGIAHDLRTPLTAICGYLELMERAEKSAEMARYLEIVSGRVAALRRLAEELFEYSVADAVPRPVAPEPVNLVSALEESLLAMHSSLQARGIEPEIQLPEGRVMRMLDPVALGRVFSNVLANAIKYSEGDLRVRMDAAGEICFSNAAKALDGVQTARLFDRFYTVEAARRGTGLGLSIARTLTERMGGSIWAVCQNGRLALYLRFEEGAQDA